MNMLEPDLGFVRSDIDLGTVKPIETKQLIKLINEYLIRSSDIVNAFCTRVERKILALDRRLNSFERQLILLERKLENVAIDSVKCEEDLIKNINLQGGGNQIKNDQQVEDEKFDLPETSSKLENPEPSVEDPVKVEANTVKAKDHPDFGKYFKMLKMGVPEPAVQLKMRSEGFDPSILADPDKYVKLPENRHKPDDSFSERDSSDCDESSDSNFTG